MTGDELLSELENLFGSDRWPEQLKYVEAARRIAAGEDHGSIRAAVGTSLAKVKSLASASDPVAEALGIDPETVGDDVRARARRTLGQQVLGLCGELAFEQAYKEEMQTQELRLDDKRDEHSDTDYRLVNGGGRPIYRINIKTHGSRFARAQEMVGLEPEDCFALATYKIYGALRKQEDEQLPYIFAVIGVPAISGDTVGAALPDALVELMAVLNASKVSKTRKIEDAIVIKMAQDGAEPFASAYSHFAAATWYLLSARRAYNLLRDQLFDRVFALRERGFAQNFRGAELNMHFSIAADLTPLSEFLAELKQHGLTKVAIKLDRGDY